MLTPLVQASLLMAINSSAVPCVQVAIMRPPGCQTVRNRSQSPASRHTTQFCSNSAIFNLASRLCVAASTKVTHDTLPNVHYFSRHCPRFDRDVASNEAPGARDGKWDAAHIHQRDTGRRKTGSVSQSETPLLEYFRHHSDFLLMNAFRQSATSPRS